MAEELNAIDAELEQTATEIVAPNGIRITVNREEDEEFRETEEDVEESLDYEDETIYLIPDDELNSMPEDDANTVAGEDYELNNSFTSSKIISFKQNKGVVGKKVDSREIQVDKAQSQDIPCDVELRMSVNNCAVDKPIADMTPNELVEANSALRKLMVKLMQM